MERNVARYLAEYERICAETPNKGSFYYSDLKQLYELGTGLWDIMNNSLSFGFMVGYRCAKNEAKKKRTAGTVRKNAQRAASTA